MFGFLKKSIANTFLGTLKNGTGGSKTLDPSIMYQNISIAFACVEKIASQAESFCFDVKVNDKIVKDHPALKLLFGRQLLLGGQSCFGQSIRNILISGESFVLRMPYGQDSNSVNNLQPLFSADVSKNTRNPNVIDGYWVAWSGQSIYVPIDLMTGYSDLLRISLFDSVLYNSGASPMEAVGIEGRLIQDALRWNLSTLAKGVKPSAVFSSDTPVNITSQQQNDLADNIRKLYSGSDNANNAIILPAGLKFNQMQMTASDMDFAKTIDIAMKDIAMAFKVPLPLLFADASTLDNYKMAIEEFILQTVIPLTENIIQTFAEWYNSFTGDKIRICIDLDKIDGLETKREIKSKRLIEFVKNGILSPNEAREMLGYEKYNDITADSLFLPSSLRPIEIMDGQGLINSVSGVVNDPKE